MYVIDTGSNQLQQGTDVTGQTCITTCQTGQYKIVFRGQDLDTNSVAAGNDSTTGQPIVTFAWSNRDNARTNFANYTNSHIGQYLTIILDNQVIESATIQATARSPASPASPTPRPSPPTSNTARCPCRSG
jgi:preprotein translocase subunit SecD